MSGKAAQSAEIIEVSPPIAQAIPARDKTLKESLIEANKEARRKTQQENRAVGIGSRVGRSAEYYCHIS